MKKSSYLHGLEILQSIRRSVSGPGPGPSPGLGPGPGGPGGPCPGGPSPGPSLEVLITAIFLSHGLCPGLKATP